MENLGAEDPRVEALIPGGRKLDHDATEDECIFKKQSASDDLSCGRGYHKRAVSPPMSNLFETLTRSQHRLSNSIIQKPLTKMAPTFLYTFASVLLMGSFAIAQPTRTIDGDFADPCVIQGGDGYYAFRRVETV